MRLTLYTPEWYDKHASAEAARYQRIKREGGPRYQRIVERRKRLYWAQFTRAEKIARRKRADLRRLLLDRAASRAQLAAIAGERRGR